MLNVLVFIIFDFVPALLIYCMLAAIIKIGYQKRKAQKAIKEQLEKITKNK